MTVRIARATVVMLLMTVNFLWQALLLPVTAVLTGTAALLSLLAMLCSHAQLSRMAP